MTLRSIAVLLAVFLAPAAAVAQGRFDLVGFASVEADGLRSTTGGRGGRKI